jgi:hypothetical protein
MALAGDCAVNSTYSPAATSFTHFWPEDSVSTRKGAYLGPRTVPVVFIFSASQVVHGLFAPILARAEPEQITREREIANRNIKEFIVISTAE